MKMTTVMTENEGYNVLYALRKRYGEGLHERTLIKKALREITEQQRRSRWFTMKAWTPKMS